MRTLAAIPICLTIACGSPDLSTRSPTPSASNAPPAPAASPPPVRDPWRDARQRGIEFRAVGQEPGWYLEIDGRRSMRLVYDYGEREAVIAAAAPVVEHGTTTYRSTTSRPAVVVAIDDRPCGDAMSGQPFPSSVTVTIDGRMLQGCGRELRERAMWTASARQVGPVRIGMTVEAAEAALGAPFEATPDGGECVYRGASAAPRGVLFMQVGERIARIDVTGFDVRTDNGIGVGDSEMQVRDAFGAGVETTVHKYIDGGHYLTIAAADHRIIFETDGQWVTRYRVGRLPEVEWVEGCS